MPNGEAITTTVLRGEQNEPGNNRESLRTEKQPDNYKNEAAEQSGGVLLQVYTHHMPVPKVFQTSD